MVGLILGDHVWLDNASSALVAELHQAACLDGLTEKCVHKSKRVVRSNDPSSASTGLQ